MFHYSVYSAILLAGIQPDQHNSSSVESFIIWQITLTISQDEHDRVWSKKKRKGLWEIRLLFQKNVFLFWKRIIIPIFLCNWLCLLWNADSYPMHSGLWPMECDPSTTSTQKSSTAIVSVSIISLIFFPCHEDYMSQVDVSPSAWIFEWKDMWRRKPQLPTCNISEK